MAGVSTVDSSKQLAEDVERLLSPRANENDASLLSFVGALPAGGLVEHLQASLSLSGQGLLVVIKNFTTHTLTLEECYISQGVWKLPPPSGLSPCSRSYFGAIAMSEQIHARATFVDRNCRRYILSVDRSSSVSIPNGKISPNQISRTAAEDLPLETCCVSGVARAGLAQLTFSFSET